MESQAEDNKSAKDVFKMNINEAYQRVIEEISKNDNFFSETLKELRKNNLHLMARLSKITATADIDKVAETRSLLLSLIAYKIVEMTDSMPEIEDVRSCISYFNSAFNADGDENIPFCDIKSLMEECLEIILLEDKAKKVPRRVLRETLKTFDFLNETLTV